MGELIRHEGRAIVGVKQTRQSVLQDELLQALFDRDWGDLVDTLYKKGYLLKRLQMSKYSLPLWMR